MQQAVPQPKILVVCLNGKLINKLLGLKPNRRQGQRVTMDATSQSAKYRFNNTLTGLS